MAQGQEKKLVLLSFSIVTGHHLLFVTQVTTALFLIGLHISALCLVTLDFVE